MTDFLSPQARARTPARPGVMVVDDDDGVRDMLQEWLGHKGFSVWLAATGQESLGIYRRHHRTIDVILLDVRMPGLDGPGTLASLRRITPDIRCCFMSGELGEYTERDLLDLGAASVIRKPFCLDELARVLLSLARAPASSPEVVWGLTKS